MNWSTGSAKSQKEAAILLRIANLRSLARDANVAKVDAGPNAIALTPRADMTKKAIAGAGLVEKKGRLLLEASIASSVQRLAQAEDVLRDLTSGRKGGR